MKYEDSKNTTQVEFSRFIFIKLSSNLFIRGAGIPPPQLLHRGACIFNSSHLHLINIPTNGIINEVEVLFVLKKKILFLFCSS